MKVRYVFITLAAFVLGFGSAWLFGGGGNAENWFSGGAKEGEDVTFVDSSNPRAATGTMPLPPSSEKNRFIAEDQLAGNVVTVSSLVLAQDTWVAVEEEREGARVAVLGAMRVVQGEYELVRVELLRGIVPGGSYAVVLRGDDGIAGFDSAKDAPLTGADGEVIMKRFGVSSIPSAVRRDGCVISGCNNEECTDQDTRVLNVCVALPRFACYKTAVCEKQDSGQCGWTAIEELKQCLAQYE